MRCLLSIVFLFPLLLRAETPVVVISHHYAEKELEAFARWFADEMDWDPNVYILIEFKYDLPGHVAGYTLYEKQENLPQAIHQFMIRLDGSLHVNSLRNTLAHELVHVRQILEGRLVLHSRRHVVWQNESFRGPYWKPHDKRPWEEEAIGLGADLVARFRQKNS